MNELSPYRQSAIARSFGGRANGYERGAALQRDVAARLAGLLPELARPRVLELGCGTGLFSRHLLARYPEGDFVFSDLSPEMLDQARSRLAVPTSAHAEFQVLDAQRPLSQGPFDLIATSMSLHWLKQPAALLQTWRGHLAPGGAIVFSGLGQDCFTEWRDALRAEHLPSGLVALDPLPGVLEEDRIVADAGGLAFLRRLKSTGAATPNPEYAALGPGALRRALRRLDRDHAGRVTWHVVYGRLSAMDSSDADSRSSPSTMPR